LVNSRKHASPGRVGGKKEGGENQEKVHKATQRTKKNEVGNNFFQKKKTTFLPL